MTHISRLHSFRDILGNQHLLTLIIHDEEALLYTKIYMYLALYINLYRYIGSYIGFILVKKTLEMYFRNVLLICAALKSNEQCNTCVHTCIRLSSSFVIQILYTLFSVVSYYKYIECEVGEARWHSGNTLISHL